ncbi:DnaJ-domain-containing protein [Pluteus cervinus]|uniref:DnaJ-domain-containing protein n=1 Tax=Pluteus cervinus TaxID=181527 RepID=A0ACD3B5H0_9AGAR|nr:DnaJ-domain-containing protein [Pluteus cervinus]
MLPYAGVLAFFLFLTVVSAADLYKILDLHKSASEKDIRYAYKKLSKKYHPDRNKEPNAEGKFVEIAHAYEVLSDPQKRSIYDRHGEEGLKAHDQGQGQGNPFDMFQNFFGRELHHPIELTKANHVHIGQNDQVRRGPSSTVDFEVQLSDIYSGAHIDFKAKKKILCDHCRGSGAASDSDIHTCGGCGGNGVKVVKQQIFPGMFAQSQVTCNDCGGRGRVIVKSCPNCGGHKVLDHTASYTLEIPAGLPEGHEIVFEGEADESPDYEAGDIIIRVRSKKDKGGWRRKESSLYWTETIGIDEALLGFERNLTHLDGHIVKLVRKGVTQPGFVQVIEDEGMPNFEATGHGTLFIEYNVVLPIEISPQTRRKLAEAFSVHDSVHDEL